MGKNQLECEKCGLTPLPRQPLREQCLHERGEPRAVIEIAGFADGLGLCGVGMDRAGDGAEADA